MMLPPPRAATNFQSASSSFNLLPLPGIFSVESLPDSRSNRFRRTDNRALSPQLPIFYRNPITAENLALARMHRIAQYANSRYANLDGVTRNQRPDSRRCAGGNQIAWQQRHHSRNPPHD